MAVPAAGFREIGFSNDTRKEIRNGVEQLHKKTEMAVPAAGFREIGFSNDTREEIRNGVEQLHKKTEGINEGALTFSNPVRGNLCYPEDMPSKPCSNSLLAFDPDNSKIWLKGGSIFTVGDEIKLHVKAYDGLKRPKYVGGDQIRPRMWSDATHSSVAGRVIDNQNGTYEIYFKALWTGVVNIEVEVIFPKEIIAAIYRTRNEESSRKCGSSRARLVELRNKYCIVKPKIEKQSDHPDGKSVCNFTALSRVKDSIWFCSNPNISPKRCDEWMNNVRSCWSKVHKLSKCEEELANRHSFIIGDIFQIQVTPAARDRHMIDLPTVRCTDYNTTKLWFKEDPAGFFHGGIWHLGHCRGGTTDIGKCLRNKTILFHGDSTLFQWRIYLFENINVDCINLATGKPAQNIHKTWQDTIRCTSEKYNFIFMWIKIPNSPPDIKQYLNTFTGVLKTVDQRYQFIMVATLFLHYDLKMFKQYRAHMTALRTVFEKVLHDFRSVKLFLKLPHTHRPFELPLFELNTLLEGSDYVGHIFTCITKDVFTGMHDKVIALDQKDATISEKSQLSHPEHKTVAGMVKQLFNYIC